MIKIIKLITKKVDWGSLINFTDDSEFYHTYDYHYLSKKVNETPVLIEYTEQENTILLPLLIRKIEGTEYFDATSVYGYSGPSCRNIKGSFDHSLFKKELQSLFLEMNIVSVFSRLNPFVNYQENILKGMGEITSLGKIVYIDLTKDLDEQKAGYHRRLRTYINKARKQCSVRLAESNAEIEEFIAMYYENMKRVNAEESFFYDKEYFFNLLKAKEFETDLLLAIHNDSREIIGGAMFIKKNKIVQYHLSGTKTEFLAFNAIKLLIDEMRIRATKENYNYLNLGGGVGTKEDSLFYFKAGFSKDYKTFKLWKYIVNERVYEELDLKKHQKDFATVFKSSHEYFPSYRCVR
ncbi:MAG: GNAT family N-acetyltransferase [Eudoraea sp.]|nr:GNAT family N-acetyltransferase [Eudoraea sp.]